MKNIWAFWFGFGGFFLLFLFLPKTFSDKRTKIFVGMGGNVYVTGYAYQHMCVHT